jgi:hypothetical protein
MTAEERLARIRIKIERAIKHMHELQAEVQSFLDMQPYKVGVKRDPDTRRLIYYVLSVEQPPPLIAAITGDILQNLRSALDHLAYHLADIGTAGKGPFRHIYFPISENATKYHADLPKKVKGIRPDAIKAIDALKPYGGGNDIFWRLHRLNNIDKHRLLVTVGSAYNSVNIGPMMHRTMKQTWIDAGFDKADDIPMLDLFLRPADRLFPLRAGDELFVDLPEAELDEQMQFRFEIAFGEPKDVAGEPLTEALQQMIDVVENTVVSFKSLLI